MSLVCAQCSRVNPPDAAYCYHDGAALAGRSGGPINAGSAPFPNQFVFPNGQACRNFDQLAVACQEHWSAAIDLLKQGFLGSFFGGLGRVDLAMAAQEAAKFPDIDRGLDQLLAKLPTQALQPPKLQAEPSEINLGQIRIGQDRASELHLTNLGMRLLYGKVVVDNCKWLAVGDAPGHDEKLFQFGSESVMPIRVRGQHLRAASKPLQGELIVESNGGTSTVIVKADVPITPFPGGPFDGATTPRKIAEKAKADPKGTASYFEGGAVAKWYSSNGWPYPVQGPIMSGMGSIQQFFEALGVAKAPKIEFSVTELNLNGAVGETVQSKIEVTTSEKKVVYGYATCDQSWVEIGKTKISGKAATIPITVRVPSPAPPTLEANLNVFGNGGQKRQVLLRVKVAGGKKGVKLEQAEELVVVEDGSEPMVVVMDEPVVMEIAPKPKTQPPAPSRPVTPMPASGYSEQPVTPTPAADADDNPFAITDTPASVSPARTTPTAAPDSATPLPAGESGGRSFVLTFLLMVIPIVLMGCVLSVLVGVDVYRAPKIGHVVDPGGGPDGSEAGAIDSRPYVRVQFDEGMQGKDYTDSMNFGVHALNPNKKDEPSLKLNWYENGVGNSIVSKVDGTKEYPFGNMAVGRWSPQNAKDAHSASGKFGGRTRTFEFTKERIFVTQTVTIEPGDPVAVGEGEKKEFVRPLNTCLARYKIHNKDSRPHKFGLRIILDTCIGENDGVPFTLPGVNELVSDSKLFIDKEVPAFVQVLQKPDLRDPGVVVQLSLRLGEPIEPPSKFLLTRYPRGTKIRHDKWDVPIIPFGDDSCVVMYWEEKELRENGVREVGFTYGIGNVEVGSSAKLGVSVGGAMHVKGELNIVAFVSDPNAKTVSLKLPKGLELIEPKTLGQPITTPPRMGPDNVLRPVPFTWRVRALEAGAHVIEVSTDTGLSQSRRVTITKKSLFN